LPTGGYAVFVACGDAAYTDQINTIDMEGLIFTDPDGRDKYDEYNGTVTVVDGRLTIKPAPGGTKCKLLFLHITRIAMPKATVRPTTGALHPTQATLSWVAGDLPSRTPCTLERRRNLTAPAKRSRATRPRRSSPSASRLPVRRPHPRHNLLLANR
jgi:hypothetical protein